MTIPVLYTLAGIALLFVGGEGLLRGSVAIAQRAGISPLLVGMTIVAAGTSAPELVVSVNAALAGSPDIALGNVVGSNICNIMLILGVSAALVPIAVNPLEIRRDLKVLIGATVALVVIVLIGEVGRVAALGLLVAQVVYVVGSYVVERRRPSAVSELYEHETEQLGGKPKSIWLNVAFVVGGALVLVLGSNLLVAGASEIARALGVSEAIIGLTLVALGTSLPELATSVVSAARGHSDVAVGNVIGSNIFNSLLIVGAAGLVAPLTVPDAIAEFDVWIMLAVVLIASFVLWRGRMARWVGVVSVAGYVAYTVSAYVR